MKKGLKIIYNFKNKIFEYGLYISYAVYYAVNVLNNLHLISRQTGYLNDYRKINERFQSLPVKDYCSLVCKRMTDNIGAFNKSIPNELKKYPLNIDRRPAYGEEIPVEIRTSRLREIVTVIMKYPEVQKC